MTNLTRRNFIIGSLGVASTLGLAACGGNSNSDADTSDSQTQELSQEEMLEQAEDFDYEAYREVREENEARAKQEYDGKVFRRTGYVEEIRTDYIILSEYIYGGYYNPLVIELPEDVIAGLSREQEITVCGTFQYEEDPNISRLVDAFIVE